MTRSGGVVRRDGWWGVFQTSTCSISGLINVFTRSLHVDCMWSKYTLATDFQSTVSISWNWSMMLSYIAT